MDRKAIIAVVWLTLMLHACDRVPAPPEKAESSGAATTVASPHISATPASTPPAAATRREDGINDGYPDLTPPILTYEAERSAAGPRNVLQSFARAIELKEFDQAWALLSPSDKQKWSKPAFARMFADLGEITVAIPDGTGDAGCGSVYYTAPVTITADDKDGRPTRIEGEALLRRVNDVDGASPAQLRWHFERLTLDWTH